MTTLTEAQFLEWAVTKGLQLDPRYPHSATLSFNGAPEESRFWEVPIEARRRPYFLNSLLTLLGNWQICYVWRHLGRWPTSAAAERIDEVVELQILKGLSLPLGTTDVVAFSRDEIGQLVTLMFSTTVFGWTVSDDLYVVPDHAESFLQTDHHDVVHVVCKNPADIRAVVAGMEKAGFALPDDLPDSTFKSPSWMKRGDG